MGVLPQNAVQAGKFRRPEGPVEERKGVVLPREPAEFHGHKSTTRNSYAIGLTPPGLCSLTRLRRVPGGRVIHSTYATAGLS